MSVVESIRSEVSSLSQGDFEKVLSQLGVKKPTEGAFCPRPTVDSSSAPNLAKCTHAEPWRKPGQL